MRIENFEHPDWATANVYFRRTNGTEDGRVEIINKRTKQRYVYEELNDTRIKGALLATLGIPASAVFSLAAYVVRFVTLIFSLIFETIANFFKENPFEAFKKLIVNITYEIPAILVETIWSIAKTVICAPAMEFCAIATIFNPLKWRVHLGDVERFWRGTDRRHNIWTVRNSDDGMDACKSFFTDRKSPYGCFIAYCFQPWGSLDDVDATGQRLVIRDEEIPPGDYFGPRDLNATGVSPCLPSRIASTAVDLLTPPRDIPPVPVEPSPQESAV
jgi:hypothetical protein